MSLLLSLLFVRPDVARRPRSAYTYRFNKPRKPGWTRRAVSRSVRSRGWRGPVPTKSWTSVAKSCRHAERRGHRYVHASSLRGVESPRKSFVTARAIRRGCPCTMDLAGDLSHRSDSPCEGSREHHHASFANCTLTFPIFSTGRYRGERLSITGLGKSRDVANPRRHANERERERERAREGGRTEGFVNCSRFTRVQINFLLIFASFGICLQESSEFLSRIDPVDAVVSRL